MRSSLVASLLIFLPACIVQTDQLVGLPGDAGPPGEAGPRGDPGTDAMNPWGAGANGAIYYNGGAVGIGTLAPDSKVDVRGQILASEPFGVGYRAFFASSNSDGVARIGATSGAIDGGQVEARGPLAIQTDDKDRIYVSKSGNIGVGTTTPTALIHVESSIGVQEPAELASYAPLKISNGTDRATLFDANQIESAGGTLYVNASSTNNVVLAQGGGKVSIGNGVAPAATLDVHGTARLGLYASPPVVCDATREGTIAMTTAHFMCVCDGLNGHWVRAWDGTSPCLNWP